MVSSPPASANIRCFDFAPGRSNTLKITNMIDETVAYSLRVDNPSTATTRQAKGFVAAGSLHTTFIKKTDEYGGTNRWRLTIRRMSAAEQQAVRVQNNPELRSKALGMAVPAEAKLEKFLWERWGKERGPAPKTTVWFDTEWVPDCEDIEPACDPHVCVVCTEEPVVAMFVQKAATLSPPRASPRDRGLLARTRDALRESSPVGILTKRSSSSGDTPPASPSPRGRKRVSFSFFSSCVSTGSSGSDTSN